MGGRCKEEIESNMKKAVVVDFDLTLVSVNSFELFYKHLAIYSLGSFRLFLFAFLAYHIALRKLRLITHAGLKVRTLLFLGNKKLDDFMPRFVALLQTRVSMDVVKQYEAYRQKGYSVCLCTAAPLLYIEPFLASSGLKFDDVVCSPQPVIGNVWEENLNERKKVTTMELMERRGEELAVFMTDHMDDLPLLLVTKEKNILVRPTAHSLDAIKSAGVQYELMH